MQSLNNIQAGFILTAVGSLQQAVLRFAGQSESQCFFQQFEIISLGGTLSHNGIHLHIGLADRCW
ncbi:MAG: PPC domain-containing DNA-binding protein [Microcoleaceae cyanobacterium]